MASRYFALIPAAGHSSRMGRPKLLLPLFGKPLVQHTIEAWRRSRVDRTVVVARPGDELLLATLRLFETAWPDSVDIVIPPIPPPDMKASLQAALTHIERVHDPSVDDAFLVAPADMPHLSMAIINRLIQRHASDAKQAILAPTIACERGHPVLFPWIQAAELFQLRQDEGLNAIVERNQVDLILCDDLISTTSNPFADVDTPEEYERLMKEANFNEDHSHRVHP